MQMAMKAEGKQGLEEAENSKIRITLTSKSVAPLEKSTYLLCSTHGLGAVPCFVLLTVRFCRQLVTTFR